MSEQRKMDAQELDLDGGVSEALRSFRQSVHAWSEAEFARPRAVALRARVHRPWAIIYSTLGLVLATGVAVTSVHERDVHLQQQRIAAAERQAEQQRELAAQRAKESEDLLANVDKDVSREVPSALEPLAQMMDDSSQ